MTRTGCLTQPVESAAHLHRSLFSQLSFDATLAFRENRGDLWVLIKWQPTLQVALWSPFVYTCI